MEGSRRIRFRKSGDPRWLTAEVFGGDWFGDDEAMVADLNLIFGNNSITTLWSHTTSPVGDINRALSAVDHLQHLGYEAEPVGDMEVHYTEEELRRQFIY